MCCDVATFSDARYNRSCCPGVDTFNLFSIGSELGTATSFVLSSSSVSEISSTSSSRILSSNGVIHVDKFATLGLSFTTALSSANIAASGLSISPSLTSSFSSETSSATTLASVHSSTTNKSTVAMPVGVSIGAAVFVIASILSYRQCARTPKMARRKKVRHDQNVSTVGPEVINHPQELSGRQDHELPTSERYLTQELP